MTRSSPTGTAQGAGAATPQPDENPEQRAKLEAAAKTAPEGDHSPPIINEGEDSLQKQARRETTRNQSGVKKASERLSDENGDETVAESEAASEGDLQESKRGRGQEILS